MIGSMRWLAWLLILGPGFWVGKPAGRPSAQEALSFAPDPGRGPEQRAAVLAERRSHFHAMWADADPERRAAAAMLLEARLEGSDLHRPQPDLALLATVSRALRGEDAEVLEHDPLARLADRLDLRSVPVTVPREALATQTGIPLTIQVQLLESLRPQDMFSGTADLTIRWIAPDGSEIHARREPFSFKAFTEGFPMYLRLPAGARGLWHLVPILERGERTVRGWPAPVELVPELEERMLALKSEFEGTEPWIQLLRWTRRGIRWADRSGVEGRVRVFEEGSSSGESRSRWTADVLIRAQGDAEHPGPRDTQADVPHTLLFVASSDETAPALFHGPIGRAWIAWAAAHDVHLAAVRIRDVVGTALGETVSSLCTELGTDQLTLCARGDAALTLHLAFAKHAVPQVKRLILIGAFGPPGPVIPKVPTLLIGVGGSRETDPDHVERIAGDKSLLLLDLTSLEHVDAWLGRRTSAAQPEEGR